ncbi:acetate--CoA ligase family protein [Catenulispora yoronensis]
MACARLVLARNEHTAVAAAGVWDGPVVLKAYWPELVHKSDVDGVLLGLSGEADVRAGWRLLTRRFGDRLAGVVVQETANKGVELLVGVDSDPVFGPLVGFGVGGTDTELIGGHRFALTPLTDLDADRLLAEPRAARLLAGYRGRPGADAGAVREVLARLARLAAEQPCVAEAEINPLIATPEGRWPPTSGSGSSPAPPTTPTCGDCAEPGPSARVRPRLRTRVGAGPGPLGPPARRRDGGGERTAGPEPQEKPRP